MLQQIQDHVRKALGKGNPNLFYFFVCVAHFHLFFDNFQNNAWTKIDTADWIPLVEPSGTKVSGPSDVPWFV